MSATHHLGFRAFLLFFGRRLKWPIAFAILLIGTWTQKARVPEPWRVQATIVWEVAALLWCVLLLLVMLRSYFEYKSYSYRFDNEFFHVIRGYFVKDETGIVYHQIQHVTVKSGVLDRLIGVRHLVIVMNVGADESSSNRIILPALDSVRAALIQQELLRKAHRHAPAQYAGEEGEDEEGDGEDDYDGEEEV